MFEGLKNTINQIRNPSPSVKEAVNLGKGIFSLVGNPQQTREVAQAVHPSAYQTIAEPVPQSYSNPVVNQFALPLEQVEKNLLQEAKINARKICAELRKRGVKMRILFTLMVKDLEEEQKLLDFEKLHDIDGIDDITELPEDIREALTNKMKLEKFNQLTSSIEDDLLELLQDTLFQKYRLEYLAGKHEMLSESQIIEMYTTIMFTPIYELGADILVEKTLQFKQPMIALGKQLLDKFMPKKEASSLHL